MCDLGSQPLRTCVGWIEVDSLVSELTGLIVCMDTSEHSVQQSHCQRLARQEDNLFLSDPSGGIAREV